MTVPSVREALEAERAELIAKNEAATSWGAAVGVRSARIKDIDRQLKALATPPAPTPSAARERIARHNRVIALEFCKGSFQKRLGLTNERTLVYADVIAELIDQATDYALALLPDAAAIRAAAFEEAAEVADCMADEYDATSFTSTNADQVAALRSKEQAAHEIAAAIRAAGEK